MNVEHPEKISWSRHWFSLKTMFRNFTTNHKKSLSLPLSRQFKNVFCLACLPCQLAPTLKLPH